MMAMQGKCIGLLALAAFVLTGCASDGPPVTDPGAGVSGRKHYGKENEISLYRLLRGGGEQQRTGEPVVGDAEFQEYQEWKRWREFKEYQKWKQEQGGQAPSGNAAQPGASQGS